MIQHDTGPIRSAHLERSWVEIRDRGLRSRHQYGVPAHAREAHGSTRCDLPKWPCRGYIYLLHVRFVRVMHRGGPNFFGSNLYENGGRQDNSCSNGRNARPACDAKEKQRSRVKISIHVSILPACLNIKPIKPTNVATPNLKRKTQRTELQISAKMPRPLLTAD